MLKIFQIYRNKFTNKLFGVVHLPPCGERKGDILLSYLTEPFTTIPNKGFTDPHTNKWECFEIARLFSEKGYAVDIIYFKNTNFIPRKKYTACIDIMQNLERLTPHLPTSCKKVMHITSAYGDFQNKAEGQRLENLKRRRNIIIKPQRTEVSSSNPKYADYLEGLGNQTVHATYTQFNKAIFSIPISVAQEFDFPVKKDFKSARAHFLWFGGGGAVLKGLDLVLEAFAALPDLTLHIVGPVTKEADFTLAYKNELSLPNIIAYPRPRISPEGKMLCGDIPFTDIADTCTALVYPSASEGTSGAVVQAMHAGLIPIITKQTGLLEDAPVTICEQPTVDSIRKLVLEISKMEPTTVRAKAEEVWSYAREYHTKKTFSEAYSHFIDDILRI